MWYGSKTLVTVLFAAVLATSLVAATPQLAVSTATPAGCHEHRKQPSSHHQTDYACCLAAHDSALVQAGLLGMAPPTSYTMAAGEATSLQQPLRVAEVFLSSSDPPRLFSLRI